MSARGGRAGAGARSGGGRAPHTTPPRGQPGAPDTHAAGQQQDDAIRALQAELAARDKELQILQIEKRAAERRLQATPKHPSLAIAQHTPPLHAQASPAHGAASTPRSYTSDAAPHQDLLEHIKGLQQQITERDITASRLRADALRAKKEREELQQRVAFLEKEVETMGEEKVWLLSECHKLRCELAARDDAALAVTGADSPHARDVEDINRKLSAAMGDIRNATALLADHIASMAAEVAAPSSSGASASVPPTPHGVHHEGHLPAILEQIHDLSERLGAIEAVRDAASAPAGAPAPLPPPPLGGDGGADDASYDPVRDMQQVILSQNEQINQLREALERERGGAASDRSSAAPAAAASTSEDPDAAQLRQELDAARAELAVAKMREDRLRDEVAAVERASISLSRQSSAKPRGAGGGSADDDVAGNPLKPLMEQLEGMVASQAATIGEQVEQIDALEKTVSQQAEELRSKAAAEATLRAQLEELKTEVAEATKRERALHKAREEDSAKLDAAHNTIEALQQEEIKRLRGGGSTAGGGGPGDNDITPPTAPSSARRPSSQPPTANASRFFSPPRDDADSLDDTTAPTASASAYSTPAPRALEPSASAHPPTQPPRDAGEHSPSPPQAHHADPHDPTGSLRQPSGLSAVSAAAIAAADALRGRTLSRVAPQPPGPADMDEPAQGANAAYPPRGRRTLSQPPGAADTAPPAESVDPREVESVTLASGRGSAAPSLHDTEHPASRLSRNASSATVRTTGTTNVTAADPLDDGIPTAGAYYAQQSFASAPNDADSAPLVEEEASQDGCDDSDAAPHAAADTGNPDASPKELWQIANQLQAALEDAEARENDAAHTAQVANAKLKSALKAKDAADKAIEDLTAQLAEAREAADNATTAAATACNAAQDSQEVIEQLKGDVERHAHTAQEAKRRERELLDEVRERHRRFSDEEGAREKDILGRLDALTADTSVIRQSIEEAGAVHDQLRELDTLLRPLPDYTVAVAPRVSDVHSTLQRQEDMLTEAQADLTALRVDAADHFDATLQFTRHMSGAAPTTPGGGVDYFYSDPMRDVDVDAGYGGVSPPARPQGSTPSVPRTLHGERSMVQSVSMSIPAVPSTVYAHSAGDVAEEALAPVAEHTLRARVEELEGDLRSTQDKLRHTTAENLMLKKGPTAPGIHRRIGELEDIVRTQNQEIEKLRQQMSPARKASATRLQQLAHVRNPSEPSDDESAAPTATLTHSICDGLDTNAESLGMLRGRVGELEDSLMRYLNEISQARERADVLQQIVADQAQEIESLRLAQRTLSAIGEEAPTLTPRGSGTPSVKFALLPGAQQPPPESVVSDRDRVSRGSVSAVGAGPGAASPGVSRETSRVSAVPAAAAPAQAAKTDARVKDLVAAVQTLTEQLEESHARETELLRRLDDERAAHAKLDTLPVPPTTTTTPASTPAGAGTALPPPAAHAASPAVVGGAAPPPEVLAASQAAAAQGDAPTAAPRLRGAVRTLQKVVDQQLRELHDLRVGKGGSGGGDADDPRRLRARLAEQAAQLEAAEQREAQLRQELRGHAKPQAVRGASPPPCVPLQGGTDRRMSPMRMRSVGASPPLVGGGGATPPPGVVNIHRPPSLSPARGPAADEEQRALERLAAQQPQQQQQPHTPRAASSEPPPSPSATTPPTTRASPRYVRPMVDAEHLRGALVEFDKLKAAMQTETDAKKTLQDDMRKMRKDHAKEVRLFKKEIEELYAAADKANSDRDKKEATLVASLRKLGGQLDAAREHIDETEQENVDLMAKIDDLVAANTMKKEWHMRKVNELHEEAERLRQELDEKVDEHKRVTENAEAETEAMRKEIKDVNKETSEIVGKIEETEKTCRSQLDDIINMRDKMAELAAQLEATQTELAKRTREATARRQENLRLKKSARETRDALERQIAGLEDQLSDAAVRRVSADQQLRLSDDQLTTAKKRAQDAENAVAEREEEFIELGERVTELEAALQLEESSRLSLKIENSMLEKKLDAKAEALRECEDARAQMKMSAKLHNFRERSRNLVLTEAAGRAGIAAEACEALVQLWDERTQVRVTRMLAELEGAQMKISALEAAGKTIQEGLEARVAFAEELAAAVKEELKETQQALADMTERQQVAASTLERERGEWGAAEARYHDEKERLEERVEALVVSQDETIDALREQHDTALTELRDEAEQALQERVAETEDALRARMKEQLAALRAACDDDQVAALNTQREEFMERVKDLELDIEEKTHEIFTLSDDIEKTAIALAEAQTAQEATAEDLEEALRKCGELRVALAAFRMARLAKIADVPLLRTYYGKLARAKDREADILGRIEVRAASMLVAAPVHTMLHNAAAAARPRAAPIVETMDELPEDTTDPLVEDNKRLTRQLEASAKRIAHAEECLKAAEAAARAKYQEELDWLKNELAQTQRAMEEAAQAAAAELAGTADAAAAEKEALEAQLEAALEEAKLCSAEDLQAAQDALARQKDEAEVKVADLEEQLAKQQQTEAAFKQAKLLADKQLIQLEDIQSKLMQLDCDSAEKDTIINSLKEELEMARRAADNDRDRIDAFKEDLALAEERRQSLESQVKLSTDEAALLQASTDAQGQHLEAARRHIAELEGEVQRLTDSVKQMDIWMDEAAERAKTAETALAETKRQIVDQDELEAALRDSKTAQNHLGTQLAGTQKEMEILRRRLATEFERRQSKETELHATRERCQRMPRLEGLVHEEAAARIEMQHRLTLAEEQLANAEEQKRSHEEARAAIQTTLEGVREEMHAVRRQLAATETDIEELKTQNLKLLTQRADYEARAKKHESAMAAKEVEIAKLKAQMKSQDQHLTHTLDKLNADRATVAQQGEEIAQLTEVLTETRGVLATTKDKLMEMQATLQETQADLEATRLELEAKCADMEAALLTNEALMKEAAEEYSKREEEMQTYLDRQATEFEARALAHEGVVEALELHIVETEGRFELCRGRWQHTMRDLERATADLTETSETLRARCDEHARQTEAFEAHIASLNGTIDQKSEAIAAREADIEDLKGALDEAEQRRAAQEADYEGQLAALDAKWTEDCAALERRKDEEMAAAAAEHTAAYAKLDAERLAEIDGLTEVVQQKTEEAVRDADEIVRLTRSVGELEAAAADLRATLAAREEVLAAAEAAVATLEEQLATASMRIAALEGETHDKRAEIERLEASAELLRDTLATVKDAESAAAARVRELEAALAALQREVDFFEAEKAVEIRPQQTFLMQCEQNEFKVLSEIQHEKLTLLDAALRDMRHDMKAADAVHRQELADGRVRLDALQAEKTDLVRRVDTLANTLEARDGLLRATEGEVARKQEELDAALRKIHMREFPGETTVGVGTDLVDVDALEREVAAHAQERAEWEKSLADLTDANEQLAGENTALEAQLRKACAKHAELETRHFEVTSKLTAEAKRVEDNKASHARELESVQDRMRSTTIHEGMLASELAQLQEKLRRCEEGFDHALKKNSELEGQLVSAKADAADNKVKQDMYVKTAEETKTYLSTKLEQAEQSLQKVSAELNASRASQQGLEKRAAEAHKRLADEREVVESLEVDLRGAEARIKDLQEELLQAENVQSEYQVLQKRSRDLLDQHTAFKARTRDVEDENVALRARNASLNDQMQTLRAELDNTATRLTAARQALQEREAALAACEERVRELEADEGALRRRLDELATEGVRTRAALASALDNLQHEEARRADAEEQYDAADVLNRDLKERADAQEAELQLLRGQAAALEAEAAEHKESLAVAIEEAAAAVAERDELRAALEATAADAEAVARREAVCRGELSTAAADRDAYRKAADASVQALQRLQPEVQRLNEQHDALLAELSQRDGDVAAAQAELAQVAEAKDAALSQLRVELSAARAKEEKLEERLRKKDTAISSHVATLEDKLNDAFLMSANLEEMEVLNKSLREQVDEQRRAMEAQAGEHENALKKKQVQHREDMDHQQGKYQRQLQDAQAAHERKAARLQDDADHRVKETERRLERQHELVVEDMRARLRALEEEVASAATREEESDTQQAAVEEIAALKDTAEKARAAQAEAESGAEQRVADVTAELHDMRQKCLSMELRCEEAVTQATSLGRQLQETSSELERLRRERRAGSPAGTTPASFSHASERSTEGGDSPEPQSDLMKLLEEDI